MLNYSTPPPPGVHKGPCFRMTDFANCEKFVSRTPELENEVNELD